MTTQTRDQAGAAVTGAAPGTPPFSSRASVARRLWAAVAPSPERRLARCVSDALAEFDAALRARRAPRWDRLARRAAAGSGRGALPSGRRLFALRACARDVLFHLADASRDIELFALRPDGSFRDRLAAVRAAARRLEESVDPAAPAAARRRAVEALRRAVAEVRARHEADLAARHRQDGAVRFLERRELDRHLLRAAEALGRCARPLEEDRP